jgi:succinoglycan biosynthesis protein ExoA
MMRGTIDPHVASRCAVVVPCLNEEAFIAPLVAHLLREAERLDFQIIIVDGGSTDRTLEIATGLVHAHTRVILMDNPEKLQAAAVNKAVAALPETIEYVIRIDAHGQYPADYCGMLLAEAGSTGADSVVVPMATEGVTPFQKATAIAQNSKLGNGGSKHRHGAEGHWTDHGHHALMRAAAFKQVGGYDESFSHNEDAELDCRLRQAGFRIWMTDKTRMTYFPRATIPTLFKQYLGYGRGRAKNILKHRTIPKLRQTLPLLVFPIVAAVAFVALHWSAAAPAAFWVLICLSYGLLMAVREGKPHGSLVGISAMVMHLAWSMGFWLQLAQAGTRSGSRR